MATELDEYEVLEMIGHGSFGVIRKVRRKADRFIMCRKEISYVRMSQKEREQLHAEFQILSHLRHPNIVAYYHREHLKASQDLHLYMEYCGNGDLGRVIKGLIQKGQCAQESFVWSVFSQLVAALYRCHYGCDPPDVGANVVGLVAPAGPPKSTPGTVTILHRDLKPENVFLGEDNSVKLGDFGLSKIIQSHDFASTYVGTPFYMSPEICAAEKYTLKSDIWSLGCVMYELCAREPPFNAKSHYQLVQKIKEGKVAPLPDVYSPELSQVIKDCLRINPDRRPDTAQLLNLPIVRLLRKEKEVVDLNKILRAREEDLAQREKNAADRLAALESEKEYIRHEIDASLRREWEVKARLEIDHQINQELQQLQARFENEVLARVDVELKRKAPAAAVTRPVLDALSSSLGRSDSDQSSFGAASGTEFPSTTDLTQLSDDSLTLSSGMAPKKSVRTPFARAQTMFAGQIGTPMDVEMGSPSPIAIASLSLSPRRTAATKAPSATANIFRDNAATAIVPSGGEQQWELRRPTPGTATGLLDSDDEDLLPSPTRCIKTSQNPFLSKHRPVLRTQKMAPVVPRAAQPLAATSANKALSATTPHSPNRRLSRIPSSANLVATQPPADCASGPAAGQGLVRKPSTCRKELPPLPANVRGRTLVELQQARAAGRPAVKGAGAENTSPKRMVRDRMGNRRGGDDGLVATWDPARDEMPSPFRKS